MIHAEFSSAIVRWRAVRNREDGVPPIAEAMFMTQQAERRSIACIFSPNEPDASGNEDREIQVFRISHK